MEHDIKFFVGLDVHKDSIAVAVAEAGRAPARLIGSIAHDVGRLIKLLARYGERGVVQVVYEAGRPSCSQIDPVMRHEPR